MGRTFWIALVGGMALVLVVAFALVRRNAQPEGEPVVQKSAPTPVSPPVSPAQPQPQTAPDVPVAAVRPATTPGGRKRTPLRDIADPLEAVEIVHLRRGAGDTIEIGARNVSLRAVYVKSVEIFADSDDRHPLDNVGFWLPVGGAAEARREVPELSRRLGENEGVRAVINEAEFRDAPPEEVAK
jgi:hypothetical protein